MSSRSITPSRLRAGERSCTESLPSSAPPAGSYAARDSSSAASCHGVPGFPPRRRSRSPSAWRSSSSPPRGPRRAGSPRTASRCARLCSRVENDWVGAHTGLLDQLASLCGAPDAAVLIDFLTLELEPVPLVLDGWSLAVLDSGERHAHASSGYNERRAECARACELLGRPHAARGRPHGSSRACRSRWHAAHGTCSRNASACAWRWRRCAIATSRLSAGCSTPRTRACATCMRSPHRQWSARWRGCRDAGAAGARIVGGGFGGSALGLFAARRECARRCARGSPQPGSAPARRRRLSAASHGPGAQRRAASSAPAVSGIASESAASAPSSGARSACSDSSSWRPSFSVLVPSTPAVRRRSSRAGVESLR